jgi:hypothetical protein
MKTPLHARFGMPINRENALEEPGPFQQGVAVEVWR